MYNFDDPVNRRGTQCVKWDSVQEDLLPMWIADMDFQAPPMVIKALQERSLYGVFGYSLTEKLPGIIKKWIKDEFGLSVEEEWLVLLPAIIPAARAAFLIRGSGVMLNTPVYNGLLNAPAAAGKTAVPSPLKNREEQYEMDFEDMQKKIKPGLEIFCLCNPHNPVGRVYTREELLELSHFARKNNMLVVSDEVHCGLVFDRPHIPYFSVDDYSMENSITLIGPAKTFNLPGLPFGFAVIPNRELRRDFTKRCFMFPEIGIFNALAAAAAYGESREWKNELVEYLRSNRDYLENRLRSSFPAAKLPHTEGTYLQWIDFRPLGINNPFEWLRDYPKILSSDGKIFGVEGYIRLNFGTSRLRLKEALDRLEEQAK